MNYYKVSIQRMALRLWLHWAKDLASTGRVHHGLPTWKEGRAPAEFNMEMESADGEGQEL